MIKSNLEPERLKAIKILEIIAEMLGNEFVFDCRKDDDNKWYRFEDAVTNIIKEVSNDRNKS